MVEAEATVVSVEGGLVEVEASGDGEGCGKCHTAGGCGGSAGRTILGTRVGTASRLRVPTDLALQPGDRVLVGLPQGGYLRASVALYLVPLVGLFAAAGMTEWLLAQLALREAADVLTLLAGLAGLGGGFLWQRGFGRRFADDPRYRPRVLRRVANRPPEAKKVSAPAIGT
ncbi:SoxR reducing system RseC family protein [Thiohalorhabdus sp. Cl-TMA]|uniref:SoxR reducing system RseC family protein n=1 Tax=Thiohalorhabdus methylotrophus TaxID=3242694 RepID=A0ABV4TWL6_9GAMM